MSGDVARRPLDQPSPLPPNQLFPHNQRVDAIRVVPRPGFHHAVAVAFVERERAQIVDRGLQPHGFRSRRQQAIFSRPQQQRPDSRSSRSSSHVDSNDVPGRPVVGDKKSSDFAVGVSRDQRDRAATAHVQLEFLPRIGDSRRKAFLVHTPKEFKVFRLEIAGREGHATL